MDFTIITPREIACYNQSFLFKTSVRTLEIDKIKSVRIEQEGILKSIFNYGSIIFFAEGDQTNQMGDITLWYITDPIKLRDKIGELVQEHMDSRDIAAKAIQEVAETVVERNDTAEKLAEASTVTQSQVELPPMPQENIVEEPSLPQEPLPQEPLPREPLPQEYIPAPENLPIEGTAPQ